MTRTSAPSAPQGEDRTRSIIISQLPPRLNIQPPQKDSGVFPIGEFFYILEDGSGQYGIEDNTGLYKTEDSI